MILCQQQKLGWKAGPLLKEFLEPCRDCLPLSFKHCQQPVLLMISIYYDHCCRARSQGAWKSFLWGEWDALSNRLGEPQTQTVSKPTDQEAGWGQMSLKFERGELYTLLTSFPGAPGATTAQGSSSLRFPKHPLQMARLARGWSKERRGIVQRRDDKDRKREDSQRMEGWGRGKTEGERRK